MSSIKAINIVSEHHLLENLRVRHSNLIQRAEQQLKSIWRSSVVTLSCFGKNKTKSMMWRNDEGKFCSACKM